MKKIIIAILLLITLYYFYKFLKKERENFINYDLSYATNATNLKECKVIFLTENETKQFILQDSDTYIYNLSQWDLIARKAASNDEYRTAAAASAINFSDSQKERFRRAAALADAFFRRLDLNTNANTSISSIDGNKIAEIPWIFAQTRGQKYEDGLPHTRSNVIFISSIINETEDHLVKTFIHEKIHVYERMYPEDMNVYLQNNGFIRSKRRYGIPRIRANPDLDTWVYFNEITQKDMLALYSCDEPHNITDVILNDPAYEHPYELLAYKIAGMYNT